MRTRGMRDNLLYFMAGIGFLALAKAKNVVRGYSTPKPFNVSETGRCIEYDIQVVDQWLSHLKSYDNNASSLAGKTILELGPGSDLGAGLYLLSKGCTQYNACDVNDLVASTPDEFYEQLFSRLQQIDPQADIPFLKEQLQRRKAAELSRLNYVVRKDFNIVSAFGESSIDLVFSQAAFEHFDDIDATISQLSKVCKPGAILVAEVDLKTHSRWIREKDPNNIYRYASWFYNLFWFRGIPNRLRPAHYKEALERYGWNNITVTPLASLGDGDAGYSGMNRMFTDARNQMNYLSVMICAQKS